MDNWERRRLLGMLALAAVVPTRVAAAEAGEVLVISTLYSRHRQVPAYDLAALRRLIDAVKPDVLVLDVTPTELRTRKVWPGKVEYTEVIFPYLDAKGLVAYGSEPDEDLFKELTTAGGESYQAFKAQNPAGAKALDALKQSAYQALASRWQSAADVNSDKTDRLVAALREIEEGLVGGNAGPVQQQWDRHHALRLSDAVKAHPGRRVLMLVGMESRYRVLQALQQGGDVRPVESEAWLRRAGL
ncbi:hypothetical protein J2X20_002077 [Pelomonas saccharophila]|uniref:TraB/GumN family protein n=1 Tax=Roseateles saccharophilus TaxID=304 RepID=A0ABU1YKR0_ROSSA|nr:hypothetical protein [Roseateles saccharophilus]MDR7269448.1 hypothetical protein [Roseateles saccharophilus]